MPTAPAPAMRSTRSSQRDGVGTGDASQARQNMLEAEGVHFGADATAQILRNHQLVPMFRRAARRGLNPYVGRDTAEHDVAHAATPQLQVQLSSIECAPMTLGDDQVRRRERLRELIPA